MGLGYSSSCPPGVCGLISSHNQNWWYVLPNSAVGASSCTGYCNPNPTHPHYHTNCNMEIWVKYSA